MSRYTFNPLTKQLETSQPKGVEIPESAFALNQGQTYIQACKGTSPLLIAISITLFILMLLTLAYLIWLMFIKTSDQTPTDVFSWLTKSSTTA